MHEREAVALSRLLEIYHSRILFFWPWNARKRWTMHYIAAAVHTDDSRTVPLAPSMIERAIHRRSIETICMADHRSSMHTYIFFFYQLASMHHERDRHVCVYTHN